MATVELQGFESGGKNYYTIDNLVPNFLCEIMSILLSNEIQINGLDDFRRFKS